MMTATMTPLPPPVVREEMQAEVNTLTEEKLNVSCMSD